MSGGSRVAAIGRRRFAKLVAGMAAWPAVVHAQQPAMPLIGFLHSENASGFSSAIAGFLESLANAGFVDGRTVAIEYRWAEGRVDRLSEMAAEMVRHRPSAIFAGGGAVTVRAVKEATTSIPVVFVVGADPVAGGLVASLDRPGGNVTGAAMLLVTLAPKRLEVLNELLPQQDVIAALTNPRMPASVASEQDLQASADRMGRKIAFFRADTAREIDDAFAAMAQARVGGVVIGGAPLFSSRRNQIVGLATHYAIPAVYSEREAVTAGGLASYGTSITDAFRLAGSYMGRILKGETPADLPVQQPTKTEFVINLNTAKALGIQVPPSLLGRADEVIE